MAAVRLPGESVQENNTRLPALVHPRRRLGVLRSLSLVLGLAVLTVGGLGFYWSREPQPFDPQAVIQTRPDGETLAQVPGATTVATVIQVARTLLDKPGGYLSNDVTPPGLILDNMPNWEFGVVTELRDTVRTLRDDFGRTRSQSVEYQDLRMADARLHFDHTHWQLPATEAEYREGINALERYLARLEEGSGRFHIRADNLNAYLMVVEKRLGDLSQRLSANVGELRLPGMAEVPVPGEVSESTPWMEIDDVFYQARGYAWSLLHVLRAVEVDFAPVLQSRNADQALRRIIHKLEQTQYPVTSPMILNNTGFGMLTNHSLILASYLSRANAAIIDLRILLAEN